MEKILERYERYSYAERQLVTMDSDARILQVSLTIYITLNELSFVQYLPSDI